MEDTSKPARKKFSFGRYILTLILSLIVYKIIIWLFWSTPQGKRSFYSDNNLETITTSELLQKIKPSIDSMCPKQLDPITTMDSVSVFGDDTFQYNYTVNVDKNRFNTKKLKAFMEKQLSDSLNTLDKEISAFKQRSVTIIYKYADSTGNFWFNEILSPSNNYIPK